MKVIDIFRLCIRKDKVLSKVLSNKSSGFDERVMDSAQEITIAPTSINGSGTAVKDLHGCVAKNFFVSDFEISLDNLVSDGHNVLADFVDWESSGPTYTFNKLRDHFCGDVKFCFNVEHI